jgi:hypothetical protein
VVPLRAKSLGFPGDWFGGPLKAALRNGIRAVREHALSAVRVAGTALTEGQSCPVVMIVGSVRAMAVDLLRGLGVDRAGVLRLTDEALGIPSSED